MLPLADDLRLAARRLRQRPGFTLVVILILALGLGVNTAVFTLVHAAMLQELPVAKPHELVRLGDDDNCCVNSGLQDSYSLFSNAAYEQLRGRSPELAALTAFQAHVRPTGIRRFGAAGTDSLPAQYVAANYFELFGVRPAAGRLLEPADDRAGAPPVFVMSHRAWAGRFASDPALVGAAFLVAGRPMTLVGVAEPRFFGDTVVPDPAAVWLPLGQEPYLRGAASILARPDQDWLYLIGRLAPGATRAAVAARATTELRTWLAGQPFVAERDRERIARLRVEVVSAAGGVKTLRYAFQQPLTILLAMSGLVLLIAAANIANLILARSDRQQVALQAALGATPARLVRQSLAEGLLLSTAGAAVGLLVAWFGARAIVALALPEAAYLPADLRPNAGIVAFATALALATGALFSAAPAYVMARSSPGSALHGAGRAGEHHSFVPRRSLVAVQVALSLVLLACGALLTESLRRLERQPLGFEPESRLVARIQAAPPVEDAARMAAYYGALRERLLRVPGVRSASWGLYSPMEGNNWSSGISIAGLSPDRDRDSSSWNRIGPGYFETLGTRVLRGRTILETDRPDSRRVAVVNEAFVRRFFPDADPIGRTVGIGGPERAGDFEIVGVTEDVKYTEAERPVRPMLFFPTLQLAPLPDGTARNVQLRSTVAGAIVLQLAPGASGVETELRRSLAEVDPDLALVRLVPLRTQVAANFGVNRLLARLTQGYALLALAVAALGLFGVTAHDVARRTREIGVRMALGAGQRRVLREVLAGALRHTLLGLAFGVPATLLAARALSGLLYGVSAWDARAIVLAAVVLLGSAAAAALAPARRAAAIDPARALRSE
jgi:predicted permease